MNKSIQNEELESEFTEPEIIMRIDENGRTTPMALSLMSVKNFQGRASSRLLRILHGSGGPKSTCHRSIVPREARFTQSNGRTLIDTILGTYAPVSSVTMEGLRLPAFEKD